MKQSLLKISIVSIISIGCYSYTKAQSTQTVFFALGHTNSGPATTNYLGWDAASNIPLQIRHDGNQPITFHTNGIQRMYIRDGNGLNQGYKPLEKTTSNLPRRPCMCSLQAVKPFFTRTFPTPLEMQP